MSLARSDLRKFPRPVQDVLLEADGVDGADVRMLDGGHARVYNGDREVRPIKVSASRQAEHTLRRLVPWLENNVPAWGRREKEEEMVATIEERSPEIADKLRGLTVEADEEPIVCTYGCDREFATEKEALEHYTSWHSDDKGHTDVPTGTDEKERLEEVVAGWLESRTGEPCDDCGTSYEDCTRSVLGPRRKACCGRCGSTDTHQERLIDERWKPHVSKSGLSFGFETNGKVFRCTECGHTQDQSRGLHLHEAKHTGRSSEYAAAGGRGHRKEPVADLRVASEEASASYVEALKTLAGGLGMEVVPKGAKPYAEVVRERDEALARLSLLREALEA